MNFGYEGGSAFATVENEDVAATTGQVYGRRPPRRLSADDQTVQRSRVCGDIAIFEKSSIPLPISSDNIEEPVRGVRSA